VLGVEGGARSTIDASAKSLNSDLTHPAAAAAGIVAASDEAPRMASAERMGRDDSPAPAYKTR